MAKSQSKVRKEGDFIPPDGGWGWMIVIAAGFSNLSALPFLQQFGLLFRDKFQRLGISSSKTTTIINMQCALAACVGLANGPLFRTFSYRQVSLTGSSLLVIALLLTTFSFDFTTYLISFGILYGASYGISSSANALALNTYWKKRRRLATGLSWTTTGLGPMLWPYIITALFSFYGETGTILIICGISLHAIAGALLLHPVEWHTKAPTKEQEQNLLKPENIPVETEKKQDRGYFSQIKNISRFSSQYLFNEDDPVNPGYEITDPGMPMMVRANDGYFSQSRQSRSRLSSKEGSAKTSRLNSKKPSMTNLLENRSRKSSTLYLNESKKNSSANLGALAQDRDKSKKNSSSNLGALEQDRDKSKKNSSSNLVAQEREPYKPKRKTSITIETQIPESEIEDCPTLKAPQDLKAEEKDVVEKIDPTEAKHISDRAEQHAGSKSLKSFKIEGQYGAKYNRDNHSNISQKSTKNPDELDEKKYLKDNHSNQSQRTARQRRKSNNFNYESEVLKQASMKLEEYLKEKEHAKTDKMKLLINQINETDDEDDEVFNKKQAESALDKEDAEDEQLTLWEKIRVFFDLDLLNDFTFINLVMGVNLAGFSEMNFSILTPFILGDLGKTKPEVAQFMSLLGLVDISVRFCVPFVAGKIGWENNTFFLVGVMSMAAGRIVLAYNQSYWVILMIAVIIGFGKGLRTVFVALVIPTHVPLHKLPGATGIQLLSYGIVCIALGPVVGWIKDSASTTVTLHCLNIFTWLTALSWGLEKYIRSRGQAKTDIDIIIDKV